MSFAIRESIERKRDPYRPGHPIHPNELGQGLIADALLRIVLEKVRGDPR
jgi:hypothetical protein